MNPRPAARQLAAHLDTFGFVVLRDLFAPAALGHELDRCLREGFAGDHRNSGAAGNSFRYLPMMCEDTPASLALAVQLAPIVGELLGGPALPGRAKGTEYHGATAWHRDADGPPRSLGALCYLDPLTSHTGALQVLPGSHAPDFAAAIAEFLRAGGEPPGLALATAPGDVILLDERLYHASTGGQRRRQWRVDFVPERAADDELRRWFAAQHPPDWDGGHDVDRFPSYGPAWRALDPRWDRRLEQLGVPALVAAEEAFSRARRPPPPR